ncbi:hypothetical protein [Nocardioides sp. 616]|uniref:hypothetical protein n=1 Tax=Nocardioides sp. 616 TaxID=2268090 RepID=UPI0013B41BE7|nr:hypothetical protein [Nocardioides sp. 616]
MIAAIARGRARQVGLSWWVLVVFASFVAVLATILSSASASAETTAGAETRVGAFSVVVDVPVGPPERIAAGQRLGNEPVRVVTTVATGVAANTGQKWAYRGVGRNHPGYDDAMKGRVNPRNPNGTATPEQHNLGNTTDSSYTPGPVIRLSRGGSLARMA